MAIATQKEKLKQQEESRDFFCVVSDAFSAFCTALEKQFERVRKKAERNGNNPRGKTRTNRTGARAS